MNIVAWDLSLTSTGIAYPDGSATTLGCDLRGDARLVELRDELWETTGLPHSMAEVDLVVLEDLPQARAHAIGPLAMLHGAVRVLLFEKDVPYVPVPPACLKTYATGRGNASKDDVFAEAIRRLGYAGRSKDEADALWLRAMGMDAMGEPVVTVPALHRRGLAKVAWPVLADAPAEHGADEDGNHGMLLADGAAS